MRFSEIIQFELNSTNPEKNRWIFNVRVKGKAYRQPVALNRISENKIDPVQALIELRQRVKRKRWSVTTQTDTFWRTSKGKTMEAEDLRMQTKQFLADAGISETCPYHVKHATITWLYQHGASPDRIRLYAKHAPLSTAYMDFYLQEDLGETCARIIETSTSIRKESDSFTKKEKNQAGAGRGRRTSERYLRSSRK
jgi:site-specific recombinase XerD